MKKNSTLIELIIGVLFVGALVQVLCLLLGKQHLYNAIGLWIGIGVSVGLAIHMQRRIEDALELMGEAGVKHMQSGTVLRMVVVCIVAILVFYFEWGNPFTFLLGIIALKMAAYLQPSVHKILGNRKKGG